MTDQTPATEAGRRLILRFFSFADHEETDEAEQAILAIEAEARAAQMKRDSEQLQHYAPDYARGRADALREAAERAALRFRASDAERPEWVTDEGWDIRREIVRQRAILDPQP